MIKETNTIGLKLNDKNDPKPFTPYDQIVQQFNKTIKGALDLFVDDDNSRVEIENMILNNNNTGFREQTHRQDGKDLVRALNYNGLEVFEILNGTGMPTDVTYILNSTTI